MNAFQPELRPAADVIPYVLADVAIILLAARIVGTIFEKLRQPRIVGEIVAGILIGPTVLGGSVETLAKAGEGLTGDLYPLQAFGFLVLIGQIALVFYMFLVGAELDKQLLRGKGLQMGVVAVAAVLVPVGLGFAIAGFFDGDVWRGEAGQDTTTFALFLGAGLAVTAFPVMARILQEKQMLGSPMGAVGVGSAAIVTVLMFLTIVAASASAKNAGVVGETGERFLLFLALVAGLVAIGRPLMSLATRGYEEGKPLDGNLLALMLVGALATGLATDRILGVALVGGFLFGAICVPGRPGLAAAIISRMQDAVVIFFLPIFLAVSGLQTDLRLVDSGEVIIGALVFVALMIAGKIGAGYLAGRAVGLDNRDAGAIGVLLNCRGLLILVVGLIGLQLGVITPEMQVVFVIGAIVTTMMTGPLVDLLLPQAEVRKRTAELSREDLLEADRRASGTAVIAG
jgi:Kef-type K+ transport system membrane component KefB